jgi:hypothetical protein
MATKFTKDQVVRLKAVVPQGPVSKLRMDEDGNFFYLIGWTDANGAAQERWFAEDELIEA